MDYIFKLVFAAHSKTTKLDDFEKCTEQNCSQRPDSEIRV